MTSLVDKQQSESVNMKFSFSWLKDYLETDLCADEVGNVAAFLCSDYASGITGEITYVDAGFNISAMPLDELEE